MYQLFITCTVVNILIGERTGCARRARLTQMYQNMMFRLSFGVGEGVVFLGSFAKLRKLLASSCLSVCLSIRMGTTRPLLDGFSSNLIFEYFFFENLSKYISSFIKIFRITYTLHEDQCTFLIISRSVHLRMRNVSDKSCRKKSKHTFCVQ